MHLIIGVPCPDLIPIKFVESLIGILSYTKAKLPQVDRIDFIHAGGVRTDKNRNVILKQALELNADYILWLDADMVFPQDIVEKYLEHPFHVIGCLYFKRSEPYDPVAYIRNNDINSLNPWYSLNPDKLDTDTVYEIDGLGFGGMMVDLNVYRKMGDDKWMNYDKGFHLPEKNRDGSTHDLVFCRNAQKYGYKIQLHTGVMPGHIAEKVVTVEDWRKSANL